MKSPERIRFKPYSPSQSMYAVTQTTTDTTTLIGHLESHKLQYQNYPETTTADSGYGSEENYLFIQKKQIKGFVKLKGERIIEVNHNLERHKQKARGLLLSTEGIEYRKRRQAEVEATFETSDRTKVLEDLCSVESKKCRLRPD